jgi:hypothetical protein
MGEEVASGLDPSNRGPNEAEALAIVESTTTIVTGRSSQKYRESARLRDWCCRSMEELFLSELFSIEQKQVG